MRSPIGMSAAAATGFGRRTNAADEKLDAYWTLYEALVTTTKLVAPFVPFLAETIWQNLAGVFRKTSSQESVHLCDFPAGDSAVIDEALSARMNLVRLISSLGRNARSAANLESASAARESRSDARRHDAPDLARRTRGRHRRRTEREGNSSSATTGEQYVEHEVVPNFKLLGPKLGKTASRSQAVARASDARQAAG